MVKKRILIPKNLNFLILEDTPSMMEAVVQQLKKMGFTGEINQAETVESATKISSEKKIDYFICDWNLPDGTGYEFLMSIKAQHKYKNTPFLMVTTEDGIKEILNAIREGASNYLVKPWDQQSFLEKLLYGWEKHQGQ